MLRIVILAGVAGVFIVFLLLGNSIGWSFWFIGFLLAFWFLAIEMDLLPLLIEYVLTRRAGASRSPVESIWFVDLDLESRRREDDFTQATRKNPTIR